MWNAPQTRQQNPTCMAAEWVPYCEDQPEPTKSTLLFEVPTAMYVEKSILEVACLEELRALLIEARAYLSDDRINETIDCEVCKLCVSLIRCHNIINLFLLQHLRTGLITQP